MWVCRPEWIRSRKRSPSLTQPDMMCLVLSERSLVYWGVSVDTNQGGKLPPTEAKKPGAKSTAIASTLKSHLCVLNRNTKLLPTPDLQSYIRCQFRNAAVSPEEEKKKIAVSTPSSPLNKAGINLEIKKKKSSCPSDVNWRQSPAGKNKKLAAKPFHQ